MNINIYIAVDEKNTHIFFKEPHYHEKREYIEQLGTPILSLAAPTSTLESPLDMVSLTNNIPPVVEEKAIEKLFMFISSGEIDLRPGSVYKSEVDVPMAAFDDYGINLFETT